MGLFGGRAELSPVNVPTDWWQGAWRHWEAPRNVIAGEASYQEAFLKVMPACDDGYCWPVEVTLMREPTNRYDTNAFKAFGLDQHLGYLRRQIAAPLAPQLDAVRCASFKVPGIVRGGSKTAPNFGVHVWLERRITPGPEIRFADDSWVVPWPPNEWERSS